MSTDDGVRIRAHAPQVCEWDGCKRSVRFSIGHTDLDYCYLVCGAHKRPAARTVLAEVAEIRAQAQREARAAEERQERQRLADAEAQRALAARIRAAHERGEVYPLLLPPGVPESLREHIQTQIVERGCT